MKTKLFLSFAILVISNLSFAYDGRLNLTLNGYVGRNCTIDFAPAASAAQSTLTLNSIPIALAPREEVSQEVIPLTVYETCNEDYKIRFKSLNGGLKHSVNGYVHQYSLSYPRSNENSILDFTSADALSGLALNKTIDDWRSTNPGSAGLTPYFSARTLNITIPKVHGLQSGYYSDTIVIEMSERDTNGQEVEYNAGGEGPTAPSFQIINLGG